MNKHIKHKYYYRWFRINQRTIKKDKRMISNTGKMIQTEMKRLFYPVEFLRNYCFSVILLLLCAATYFRQHSVSDLSIYDVFEGIFNGGYFTELLMIPIGYVITTNICTDIREKVYRFYVVRASIDSYIICKYVVDILFTFFITEAVLHTCFLSGASFLQPMTQDYVDFIADVYKDLLKLHPLSYYELRMLWISLITSVFIAVGMTVSATIHNLYVAALAPFLSYIMITRLQLIIGIPTQMSYEMILSGFVRTNAAVGKSVGWIFLYISMSLLAIGVFFYGVMKRSICDEEL